MEFIQSNSKKSLILGGIGSGKSSCGAHFVLRMITEYPKVPGLIAANTYSQLINATVKTITNVLEELDIDHHLVTSGANKRLEILRTHCHLYSLENFNSIRGIQVGWLLFDESAFAKVEAIQVCRGRLRYPKSPLFERHTTSPNGFNYLYDLFENHDGEKKTDEVHLVRAKTKDNIFLPPSFYETILSDYGGIDNPLARQELNGEFVNLQAGAIFWAFSRETHVRPTEIDDNFPIVFVGQDFNISNMCSVYCQKIDGVYRVFDESVLTNFNANTDHAASKIIKDIGIHRAKVIPDSSGRNRHTSAFGRTDIQILKDAGLEVVHTQNPLIRDRQNTLNNLFKQNKIVIDPKCKYLIKELETLAARDDEGKVAHVSVALGYVTWKYDPLKRDRGPSTSSAM